MRQMERPLPALTATHACSQHLLTRTESKSEHFSKVCFDPNSLDCLSFLCLWEDSICQNSFLEILRTPANSSKQFVYHVVKRLFIYLYFIFIYYISLIYKCTGDWLQVPIHGLLFLFFYLFTLKSLFKHHVRFSLIVYGGLNKLEFPSHVLCLFFKTGRGSSEMA